MADSTFPSTETFLITWLGGTCGAFITMLMYNILFPDRQVEISPSKNGHAHRNQNIIAKSLYNFNKNFDSINWEYPYRYVNPRFPKKPLILFDHAIPEFDIFFNKYPLGKIISIRFNEKMIPLLHANLFYKTTMEFDFTKGKNERWELLRKSLPYLREYEYPHDIPNDVIKKLFTDLSKTYTIANYYSEQYMLPIEYSNIYFIDFHNILFNKDKVLSQLSDITGRSIDDFVNKQYDIYLEKQHELISTKLSWMNLS